MRKKFRDADTEQEGESPPYERSQVQVVSEALRRAMGPMGGLDGMVSRGGFEGPDRCADGAQPARGEGRGGEGPPGGGVTPVTGQRGPSPIAEGLPDARDAHRIVCPPLMLLVPRENNSTNEGKFYSCSLCEKILNFLSPITQ